MTDKLNDQNLEQEGTQETPPEEGEKIPDTEIGGEAQKEKDPVAGLKAAEKAEREKRHTIEEKLKEEEEKRRQLEEEMQILQEQNLRYQQMVREGIIPDINQSPPTMTPEQSAKPEEKKEEFNLDDYYTAAELKARLIDPAFSEFNRTRSAFQQVMAKQSEQVFALSEKLASMRYKDAEIPYEEMRDKYFFPTYEKNPQVLMQVMMSKDPAEAIYQFGLASPELLKKERAKVREETAKKIKENLEQSPPDLSKVGSTVDFALEEAERIMNESAEEAERRRARVKGMM